jgi:hypothetical protein
MSRGRVQSDGSIVFPHNGQLPTLPGYTPKEGSPYTLVPDLDPCKFRILTPILKPCGEFRCAYTCKIKDNREVNYLFCNDCDDNEE